ncbi:hypothetical protein [Pseudoalteromonas galatheae]|uniref:hypothetical protein n=1 Tax=Pseudoalteromonas galatheae TaxID=579562 RepID=UPI0030CCCFB7
MSIIESFIHWYKKLAKPYDESEFESINQPVIKEEKAKKAVMHHRSNSLKSVHDHNVTWVNKPSSAWYNGVGRR